MSKQVIITKGKTGFIILDEHCDQHGAESLKTAVGIIEKIFGESLEIPVMDEAKTETLCNVATSPEPEQKPAEHIPGIKPKEPEPDSTALQKIKELVQIKDPDGLLIPRFEYDPAQEKEIEGYSNMFVVEMPDGRAMIRYKGTHYYTTKEKVMKIPYPVPVNYFRKNVTGISETAKICMRAYRQYLHFASILEENDKPAPETEQESEPAVVGSEDGTCDDITFDSCANNSPENCKFCLNESRYENKNKLAAKKPAPPLMRASVPP